MKSYPRHLTQRLVVVHRSRRLFGVASHWSHWSGTCRDRAQAAAISPLPKAGSIPADEIFAVMAGCDEPAADLSALGELEALSRAASLPVHKAPAEHEIREERITVLADRAARRKHVREERANCFGGYERFAPNEGGLFTSGAQHHANLEGSECLRARGCGRAHRDRTRCECKARRRVCLVVVRLSSGRSVIAWWDFAGSSCLSALGSRRRPATVAASPVIRLQGSITHRDSERARR